MSRVGMESKPTRRRLVSVEPTLPSTTRPPTNAPGASRSARRQRPITPLAPQWSDSRQSQSHAVTSGALALVEKPQSFSTPQALPAKRRILIVEDDPQMASAIRESLELEGEAHWSVRVASDGRHALEFVGAAQPDVVLLDVRLSDLDGAEVYHLLRDGQGECATQILFLSAYSSFDLYQRGIEDGVLLRKPFDVSELVAIVRTMLAK